MLPHPQTVIVLAASARGLASSWRRLGVPVAAIDYFGDQDLRAITRSCHVVRRAADVPQQLGDLPSDWPLVYGGAFENHPQLLGKIAADRTIIGCEPGSVGRVRDRRQLADALRSVSVLVPRSSDGIARPGDGWIWKPTASGSGHAIGDTPRSGAGYWQERIDGPSLGLQFVANDGRCAFLAAARQMARSDHEPYFCRDLQLVEIEPTAVLPIGQALVDRFDLNGPFGVDVIRISGDDKPTSFMVLECNPRYTAGMELTERVTGLSVFDPRLQNQQPMSCIPLVKHVILAPTDAVSRLPLESPAIVWDGRDLGPAWSDVPAPGMRIAAGQPFCTVYGVGSCGEARVAALAHLVT